MTTPDPGARPSAEAGAEPDAPAAADAARDVPARVVAAARRVGERRPVLAGLVSTALLGAVTLIATQPGWTRSAEVSPTAPPVVTTSVALPSAAPGPLAPTPSALPPAPTPPPVVPEPPAGVDKPAPPVSVATSRRRAAVKQVSGTGGTPGGKTRHDSSSGGRDHSSGSGDDRSDKHHGDSRSRDGSSKDDGNGRDSAVAEAAPAPAPPDSGQDQQVRGGGLLGRVVRDVLGRTLLGNG